MFQIDLSNKVAIVSGGGIGLGRAIALELAEAGADVVVGSRKLENLEKVAEEIKAMGRRSLALATDVRVPAQVNNLVQQTVDKFGGIDILVNNAGGTTGYSTSPSVPLEETSLETWDAIMGANIDGTFLLSQAVGKVMIEQKRGGKIINIASAVGLGAGAVGASPYGVSKAAVIHFTKGLASAWAEHGIYVNCIAPGMIKTPGSLGVMQLKEPEDAEKIKQMGAAGRLGKPEDIAYMAVFLASKLSDQITGQVIAVSGGVPRR